MGLRGGVREIRSGEGGVLERFPAVVLWMYLFN